MNKPLHSHSTNRISVAARSSPLSQIQVKEVFEEISSIYPDLEFNLTLVTTIGDRDQSTSLRTLGKTDFFTRDIDQLLISEQCRIAVHSAKDLPEHLPEKLKIIAVTKGIDSSDSLVLRKGADIKSLPTGSKIAASTVLREEAVRALRTDLKFVDIRGTIEQRLEKLNQTEVDGVVIAEAALIRLGFTRLNRIRLAGKTTPGQGKLAIVARKTDKEIEHIFSSIDSRTTAVYLGLSAPKDTLIQKYYHCPIIEIIPKIDRAKPLPPFTHIIFTSKSAVKIFFTYFDPKTLISSHVIAIGKQTANYLNDYHVDVDAVPSEETSEGLISLLERLDLSQAHVFWPHSELSRPIISCYMKKNNITLTEWIVYTTIFKEPQSLPAVFHELIFTSPSTIDAFLHFFKKFPKNIRLTTIGATTKKYLSEHDNIQNEF